MSVFYVIEKDTNTNSHIFELKYKSHHHQNDEITYLYPDHVVFMKLDLELHPTY